MKLPKVDDLVGKQRSVYKTPPDEPLFVAGPPGSGKTTLAVLRARFLAGPPLGRRVALVTKNRMLAALANELGNAEFDTTTMNSLVSGDYWSRFHEFVPQFRQHRSFVYDWDSVLNDYEQAEVEPLFDHMVIDEGQNLPVGFFHWASRYGAKTLTVFADEEQATDAQRASLDEIGDATGLAKLVRLTDNHRNTPEIAAVAEHFHHSMILPPAIVQKAAGGEVPMLLRLGSLDELTRRIATRYRNRGEAIGVIVQPRKQDAYQLHSAIKARLPTTRVDVYTSDSTKGAEASIRLLEPGVTVLTGESATGLEFETVFLLDLHRSLPCTSAADYRRMYMLCARARDALLLIDWPPYLDGRQLAALPGPPVLVR